MKFFSWLLGTKRKAQANDRPHFLMPDLDIPRPPRPIIAHPGPATVTISTWTPPPEETVLRITAPQLPGRRKLHDLGGHQCLLEYTNANGKPLRRQVELIDAREAMYSVLIRARTVGAPKTEVAEYRVHRMTAITGPDGNRMEPRTYLRQKFGLVIE